MRREVTVRECVEKLAEGLREFAARPDAANFIGHSSNSVRVRAAAAEGMRQDALALAEDLGRATEAEALELIRLGSNRLANMDPHRFFLGDWGHCARMIGGNVRYVLDDGVLYQVPRPYGLAWAWDEAACTWVQDVAASPEVA